MENKETPKMSLTLSGKKKRSSYLAMLPMALFTIFFLVGPMIYLIILSFRTRADGWGSVDIYTLDNYRKMAEPVYQKIFFASFKLALISTGLVALVGYPFGYFMARLSDTWKRRINSYLMIPFWVSSLLRLYGWVIVFRVNGILDKILMFFHVIDKPLGLLDSYGATLMGMIYALLPFMIFAVYSSAEKLDWTLVEASRDLGAGAVETFFRISFPLTLPGLFSGVILSFIPSMGLFFITELFGGGRVVLIGNVIHQQAMGGNNPPFAAALSVVLLIFTSVFIWVYRKVFRVKDLEGII